jgi:hypothetical protein
MQAPPKTPIPCKRALAPPLKSARKKYINHRPIIKLKDYVINSYFKLIKTLHIITIKILKDLYYSNKSIKSHIFTTRNFIHCVTCTLTSIASASHPLGPNYHWESIVIGMLPQYVPSSAYELVIDNSDQPIIVYYDNYRSALIEVTWNGVQRVERTITNVNHSFYGFTLNSSGNSAYMFYQTSNNYSSNKLWFTERKSDNWSTPIEVANFSGATAIDLEISPAGEPQLAFSGSLFINGYSHSMIGIFQRTSSAWNYEEVYVPTTSFSSMQFCIEENGKRHIVFREFSSQAGANTAKIHHLRSSSTGWLKQTIIDTPNVNSTVTDIIARPSAQPILLASTSNSGHGMYMEFQNDGWGNPEAVGEIFDIKARSASTPKGKIYIANKISLITNNNGNWESFRIPYADIAQCDSTGKPHLLGSHNNLLIYHRTVPQSWSLADAGPSYGINTELRGLNNLRCGDPRVYCYQFSTKGSLAFTKTSNGWSELNLSNQGYQVDYAIDKNDVIHLLDHPTSYYVGKPEPLSTNSIQISSPASSSSDNSALVVDSLNNPHVSLVIYEGDNKWALHYGVNRLGIWTTERISDLSYIRNTAIAIDSENNPWILASNGLYKRTYNGWINEYPLSNVEYPALVIGPSGILDGVFRQGQKLWTLTRRNGSFSVKQIDSSPLSSMKPDMALIDDEPLVAFITQFDYARESNAIRLARRIGENWQIETLGGIQDGINFGNSIYVSTNKWNEIFVAFEKKSAVNGSIVHTPQLYRGNLNRNVPPPIISGQITVSQLKYKSDGVLIEIISEAGAQYALDYTDTNGYWIRSPDHIISTSDRLRWIDCGPPKTVSHPSSVQSRLYRFTKISNNQ